MTCEFLPPANEVWGKVIFLHLSVILFIGGWYPSMHCRWYPSMPCSRGVLSQHALQVVSQHPLQWGSALGGLLWGVCSWGGLLLGGSAPGAVCSGGVCSQGGLLRGDAWWRPPGRLLLRAVRILLECILVRHVCAQ